MAMAIRLLLLLSLFSIVAPAVHSEILNVVPDEASIVRLFEAWCSKHGKAYNGLGGERDRRLKIFKENLEFVVAHNRRGHPFWLGLNQFSDLSNEEFGSRFLGLRLDDHFARGNVTVKRSSGGLLQVPASVDWRKQGAVTSPKDQGECGGCWAFSTTGAIEGINKIVSGELVSLSEQELIDCDVERDNGCNGGLMQNAFEFIIQNGGLDTESDYPYKAIDEKCNSNKKNAHVVSIDGYESIAENDETAILEAVAKQPVSVAIEAAGREFQLYSGGVFTGPCGTNVNHGVLVVGYGSEDGKDYWIVKNSWGGSWGEKGYIKIQRNANVEGGLCSINTLASYPTKSGHNPPHPTPYVPSPPPPAPSPHSCDRLHSCPSGTTCCCRMPIGRLCLKWGCCNMESAVCCHDHLHCCPADHPVCRPEAGLCLKKSKDLDGVAILRNSPANVKYGELLANEDTLLVSSI